MTIDNDGAAPAPSRHLIFLGSGASYFGIWLVNVLLTIITLGLFLPWALVRSRRYFYACTELEGARFSYHATGSSVFIGWVCIMALYIIFLVNIAHENMVLALCMIGLFVLFFPWLVTQGLRYQMLMTEINNVRFSFYASPLRAWWVMLGCPLLIMAASVVIFSLLLSGSMSAGSYTAIFVGIGIGTLVLLLGSAVMQGVYMAQWYGMLVNNLTYGTQKFAGAFSMKKCIVIALCSMLLLVPFVAVMMVIIIPAFITLMQYSYVAGGDPEQLAMMAGPLYGKIMLSYLVYFLGIMVCFSFAFVKMRNYIYGQVTLAQTIRFSSTVTIGRVLWLTVTNLLVCMITLFLAYPWAKVRFTRYVLENTHVHGELHAVPLENHSEKPAKDPANLLARGLSFFPAVF